MAAEILLEINGHKYNASGFSYVFYQVPDFKGKSSTGIKGGDIHVVLDSSYDNTILETMLSGKTRKVPCVPWEEYEPCPVSGRIQFVQNGVHVFRELAFEEAYIIRYMEKMDANGYPMSILLTISTLRLDINKFVRMDRRPETTYGFGWTKYTEKKNISSKIVKRDAIPEIIAVYWKDANGNYRIDELPEDETVTLFAQTINTKPNDVLSFTISIDNGKTIVNIENCKLDAKGVAKISNFNLEEYLYK